jgi:hypothetical protein
MKFITALMAGWAKIQNLVVKSLAVDTLEVTGLTASLPVFTDASKNLESKSIADTLTALGLTDAVVYKGAIDCSGNPNYPAADAGHAYIVSVAGRIGGGSGAVVVAGDMLVCKTDGTASGDQATVGAHWNILEKNIDLTNIVISGGTIDGTTIGGTTPTAGSFTAVKTADGTAAAPSHSFTSDPNTGVYSAGADILGIATNGTARVFVNALGVLVVDSANTSITTVKAYVGGNTGVGAGNQLRLYTDTNANYCYMKNFGSGATSLFALYNSGANPDAIVNGTGNMTIGATDLASTLTKLHVEGSTTIKSDSAYYLGVSNVDGSWRIVRSGDNLVFERREATVWVNKSTISA